MTDNKQQENTATAEKDIIDIVSKQRDFFKTGATKSHESRIVNLGKLKTALL